MKRDAQASIVRRRIGAEFKEEDEFHYEKNETTADLARAHVVLKDYKVILTNLLN